MKTNSLPTQKLAEYTFGLITPLSPDVVRSPYMEDIISSIVQELLALDYDMKWIMIRDRALDRYGLSHLLAEYNHIDGFIVPCWKHFPKLIHDLEERPDLPTVLINDFDPNIALSTVYCENKTGVHQIFNHFVKKGYKKIGMVKGPIHVSPDARERCEEFKKCAAEASIPIHDTNVYESSRFDEEAGYHVMRFWLQRGDLPEAIFCANDDLARGSILALQEKKIRIPEEVAIAGFDDSRRNILLDPPLTTVRQPFEELGSVAVQTLLRLIQKKDKAPVRLKLNPTLIVRKSA